MGKFMNYLRLAIGATAGTAGRAGAVPAPPAGAHTKFLRGDMTYVDVAGGGGGGGDVLAANDLSEFAPTAKAANARANLSLLSKAEEGSFFSSRAVRGCIRITGAGSDQITGPATHFGLGPASLSWVMWMETYANASIAEQYIYLSNGGSTTSKFEVYLLPNGNIGVRFVDAGGTASTLTLAPSTALVPRTTYRCELVFNRAGNVSLYVNGAVMASASIAAFSTINFGAGGGTPRIGNTFAGVLYAFRAFNRVLSQSDIDKVGMVGIADYADQGGTLTPAYSSDFSAGVDSWTSTGGTLSAPVTVAAVPNALQLSSDNSNGNHRLTRALTLGLGKYQRIKFDYYIPATNTTLKKLRVESSGGTILQASFVPTADAWTTVDIYAIVDTTSASMIIAGLTTGDATSFVGTSGDLVSIKNFSATQVGAVWDLDFQRANPVISTTLQDLSGNGSTFTMTTGCVQLRPDLQLNTKKIVLGGVSASAQVQQSAGSDGVMLLANAAGSDFTRLQFGKADATRPSLEVINARLLAKLADGSALTSMAVSGLCENVTLTATGITLDDSHGLVVVTASAQTITLPSAVTYAQRIYQVKVTTGYCTLATTGGQTIDGASTAIFTNLITIQSDGTNWRVIGKGSAYSLVGGWAGSSPSAGSTNYWGFQASAGGNTNQGRFGIAVPKAGVIRSYSLAIAILGTLGTASQNGTVGIIVNNGSLIGSDSFDFSSQLIRRSVSGLAAVVAAGDYIELKFTFPTPWTTAATTISGQFVVYVEE